MANFDSKSAKQLAKPIMKGTLAAARYSADNVMYRCKVLKSLGQGKLEVQFIDFGNSEVVKEDDLRQLPQNLLAYEPQSVSCGFAYVNVPRKGKN